MESFFVSLIRVFTTRDWRGHQRSMLFRELFSEIKAEYDDGKITKGFVKFVGEKSYSNMCHNLASELDFYFFEKERIITNFPRFYDVYSVGNNPVDIQEVIIRRISSLWKTFIFRATYSVTLKKKVSSKIPDSSYTKTVWLLHPGN